MINNLLALDFGFDLLPAGEQCRDACSFVLVAHVGGVGLVDLVGPSFFAICTEEHLVVRLDFAFFIQEGDGVGLEDHGIVGDGVAFTDAIVEQRGHGGAHVGDGHGRVAIFGVKTFGGVVLDVRPALKGSAVGDGADAGIIDVFLDLRDLALVDHHRYGIAVSLYEVDGQASIVRNRALVDHDVNREVLRLNRDLVDVGGGGEVLLHDVRDAVVVDVNDRRLVGVVERRVADLVGGELDADVLQRLDLLGLARLRVGPLEGDVDGLDVAGRDLALGDGVDLTDDGARGDRGHDELRALGQRALGGRNVDGHAVGVLGREGDGRVLDLVGLFLVVRVVVGFVVSVGVGVLVSRLVIVAFVVGVGRLLRSGLVVGVGAFVGAALAVGGVVGLYYISSVLRVVSHGRLVGDVGCDSLACLGFLGCGRFIRRCSLGLDGRFGRLISHDVARRRGIVLILCESRPDGRCVPRHERKADRHQDGDDLALWRFRAEHDPVEYRLQHASHHFRIYLRRCFPQHRCSHLRRKTDRLPPKLNQAAL